MSRRAVHTIARIANPHRDEGDKMKKLFVAVAVSLGVLATACPKEEAPPPAEPAPPPVAAPAPPPPPEPKLTPEQEAAKNEFVAENVAAKAGEFEAELDKAIEDAKKLGAAE